MKVSMLCALVGAIFASTSMAAPPIEKEVEPPITRVFVQDKAKRDLRSRLDGRDVSNSAVQPATSNIGLAMVAAGIVALTI
ncbi:hypothetical protein KEM54_001761 [Ascosphaera aggregata]|nr:hypothetical protein KEM54_001761 [Ascosphaera aggregata]